MRLIICQKNLDEATINVIISTIQDTFNFKPKVMQCPSKFDFAWNENRLQYNAEQIMYWATKKFEPFFLVVLPEDIYVPGLNFVFGLALPAYGAVISTFRFRAEPKKLYSSRVAKTVKHELGHVGGLHHCKNKCVMRFANSLFELDIKPSEFCLSCAKKLLDRGFLRLEYYKKIFSRS